MTNILILLAITLILYFKTLRNEIILDDVPWFKHREKNGRIKVNNIRNLFVRISDDLYSGATFGTNKEIEHLFRIVLNCITTILIYLVLGSNTISFWAAILWIVNPINNQVTCWLNGRRFIINIILTMLMLLPYGVILYPLTLIFQITSIFSPMLLAAKNPLLLLIIPITIFLNYKYLRQKIQGRFALIHDEDRRNFTYKRLIIIVKDFGHYFFKMIIPGACAFNYPLHYYWGITEEGNKDAYSFNTDFIRGTLAIGGSILLLLCLPTAYKGFGFFMIIATLQWCSIIPVNQDLADRYVSLPNVFMMLFISYFVNTYCGQYALPILIGLTIYYIVMLLEVMKLYPNMLTYWEHARWHFPNIPAPRKYEIEFYLKTDVNKAWMLCKEGLYYNKNDFTYLMQSSVCHKIIGDYGVSRSFALEAMKNYYIGQEPIFKPKFEAFLKSIENIAPLEEDSRQVKRAKAREAEKKNK